MYPNLRKIYTLYRLLKLVSNPLELTNKLVHKKANLSSSAFFRRLCANFDPKLVV